MDMQPLTSLEDLAALEEFRARRTNGKLLLEDDDEQPPLLGNDSNPSMDSVTSEHNASMGMSKSVGSNHDALSSGKFSLSLSKSSGKENKGKGKSRGNAKSSSGKKSMSSKISRAFFGSHNSNFSKMVRFIYFIGKIMCELMIQCHFLPKFVIFFAYFSCAGRFRAYCSNWSLSKIFL